MKILKFLSVLLIACLAFSSCLRDVFCEEGEGRIVTETFIIDDFVGVDLKENANVTITQGAVQEVVVTGNGNILDRLQTEVNGGVWDISLGRDCFIDLDLTIEITIPFVEELHVSSSGNLKVEDFADLGNIDMSVTGSGSLEVSKLSGTKDIDAKISGSGEILAREILDLDRLNIELSASGNFDGFKMSSKDLDARISGIGNIFVTVEEYANIRITGAGDLHYKGNPIIDADITGSGKIINEN